jgi:hypothetical protein
MRRIHCLVNTAVMLLAGFGTATQAASLALPEKLEGLEVVADDVATLEAGTVHLLSAKGAGFAWLKGAEWSTGRVSFEVRGLDKPGASFVGLAFHAKDDTTYDVVYLRPFNFNNPDPARRAHSLQYMSLPDSPWPKLRENSPGKYEAALNPAPAAEDWVRVTLAIEGRELAVFINDAKAPALRVTLLNDRLGGKIGLWVGGTSDGWFRNLR